jgi:hypothetical protein
MIGGIIDGRYRVLRKLGQGGMGAVYEAEHTGTGRHVAVKVISNVELAKTGEVAMRFQREARAAGTVETQHIVQVFDTGTDPQTGMPYIAMELLRGEDLQQLLRRLGCLHPDLALRIVGQACVGLLKAHEAGVVHRDIKPANLFLAHRDDGEIVVKLLDFGIAKVKMSAADAQDIALTRTASVLGSPLYMSPEQTVGLKNTDHRTDIWSIGAVLYEILAGRSPHGKCDNLGMLIMMICSHPPSPLQDLAPWVSADIAAIAQAALVIDVEKRFQSMAAMLGSIRRLLPHGLNIRPEMLAPVTAELRAYVAPRPVVVAPPVTAVAPWVSRAMELSDPGLHDRAQGLAGAASTASAGLSISGRHGGRLKRSAAGAIFAVSAGVALLGAGSFAAYKLFGRGASQQPVLAQGAPLASQPSASLPLAPSASASSPVAPDLTAAVERTVLLKVEPVTASVDVDDIAVSVRDGAVEIRGGLESKHRVRLRFSGRELTSEVAIKDSGPEPLKLQLLLTDTKPSIKPSLNRASIPAAKPTTPPTKQTDTAARKFE